MPFRKTIVCLANSRKHQGRCVAGLEWSAAKAGPWIRPVSGLPRGVLIYERFCGNANGRDPRLLDLIDIEFLVPQPHAYQVENARIDPGKRWTYRGTIKPEVLLPSVQRVKGPLWVNAGSTKFGMNDLIPEAALAGVSSSLMLIQPDDLTIAVTIEGEKNGEPKRRIRGEFSLNRCRYIFSVTDCAIEQQLSKRDPGYEMRLRRPLLCVSVSEVLEATRACYKLIAGVVPTSQ
jgi:Dual OB-containing domain